MLRRGCEAYLSTISTMERGKSVDLKDISEDPLVSEFPDVFRSLHGVPPYWSYPFTIELKPGQLRCQRVCIELLRPRWPS